MDRRDAAAVEALIVALPETAGSALYGMIDVLSATGSLWQQLVGEDPGANPISAETIFRSNPIWASIRIPKPRSLSCLNSGLRLMTTWKGDI